MEIYGMNDRVFKISLVLVVFIEICHGKQCLKNDDIGWRQGNIYNCTDPGYPDCCEVYNKFTCCEEPSIRNLKEQLQLWGSVFLIISVMFIIYCYYNRDSQSLCSCNCGICYTIQTLAERCSRKVVGRKRSCNIHEKHATANTKSNCSGNSLYETPGASTSYQYKSFDTFTVT